MSIHKKNYKSIAIIVVLVLLAVTAIAVTAVLATRNPSDCHENDSMKYIHCILDKAPLVDGHNDWPYQMGELYRDQINNENLQTMPSTQTDIDRLRKGHVGAQFWAAYVDCNTRYHDAVKAHLTQIDLIKRFVKKEKKTFKFARSAADIESFSSDGYIASLIGVEGGHSIDSSLAVLRMYYELGVRYMTLTHNCNTPWADQSGVDSGVTIIFLTFLIFYYKIFLFEEGGTILKRFVSVRSYCVERNESTWYVLDATKAPIIFSHSSAYTLCHHRRNVRDDIMDKLPSVDGVIMVNFYTGFISCYPSNSTNSTIDNVIEHIDYIKKRIGYQYVGIGGDYDGVDTLPEGLEDVSKYPNLFYRLYKENGWTKKELLGLAGGNLLRVFKKVEKVSNGMQKLEISEDLISVKRLEDANATECLRWKLTLDG
ncbi:hypothetical protein SNEBB_004474 [Seison nebaliae]|nr:hypothetical protein SNEBB_004474 [Seison nebaliae]